MWLNKSTNVVKWNLRLWLNDPCLLPPPFQPHGSLPPLLLSSVICKIATTRTSAPSSTRPSPPASQRRSSTIFASSHAHKKSLIFPRKATFTLSPIQKQPAATLTSHSSPPAPQLAPAPPPPLYVSRCHPMVPSGTPLVGLAADAFSFSQHF